LSPERLLHFIALLNRDVAIVIRPKGRVMGEHGTRQLWRGRSVAADVQECAGLVEAGMLPGADLNPAGHRPTV
jgi:hypothetical protein